MIRFSLKELVEHPSCNFKKLNCFFLKISLLLFIRKMDNNTKQTDLEKEYLESLDEKQLQAYNIAKNHLGESYSLVKSNGFLEFLKQRKETQTK